MRDKTAESSTQGKTRRIECRRSLRLASSRGASGSWSRGLGCVATHKRLKNDDNPKIIEETRQYIRDFDRLAETTKTAQELYDKMLELYPNRINPGWALWSSARADRISGEK